MAMSVARLMPELTTRMKLATARAFVRCDSGNGLNNRQKLAAPAAARMHQAEIPGRSVQQKPSICGVFAVGTALALLGP